MEFTQSVLSPDVESTLIRFSCLWEQEDSCFGYRQNTREDLQKEDIFLALEDGQIIGYLLCHLETQERPSPTIPQGSRCLEIQELYILPAFRSRGIGQGLFEYVAGQYAEKADYITLSTATKNHKAILHFYIEELGMTFWSARLFRKF